MCRGILRRIIDTRGLNGYVYGANVPMANSHQHEVAVSKQVKDASLAEAKTLGREWLIAI